MIPLHSAQIYEHLCLKVLHPALIHANLALGPLHLTQNYAHLGLIQLHPGLIYTHLDRVPSFQARYMPIKPETPPYSIDKCTFSPGTLRPALIYVNLAQGLPSLSLISAYLGPIPIHPALIYAF